MKLVEINRNFIRDSFRSVVDAPIKAVKNIDKPIIAIEKWSFLDESNCYVKKFFFESLQDRNRFVTSLLNYESESGHQARLSIDKRVVVVELATLEKNKTSELDKAYSRYADLICKDIAYNPLYERE
jgi:pterin-4a-carbinolamine dehydratase